MSFISRTGKSTRSEAEEGLISETAAGRVIESLIAKMVEAGYTYEQAHAVSNAFREYLLRADGYEERARRILSGADFKNGAVDEFIEYIDDAAKTANAAPTSTAP